MTGRLGATGAGRHCRLHNHHTHTHIQLQTDPPRDGDGALPAGNETAPPITTRLTDTHTHGGHTLHRQPGDLSESSRCAHQAAARKRRSRRADCSTGQTGNRLAAGRTDSD